MKRRVFYLTLLIGITALALAACTPASAPSEAPAEGDAVAAETGGEPAADDGYTGGTLVWVGHQEVSGLSPNDQGPTVQWAMISNIHDPLLFLDENYELQPYLAESYEVSEDGLQYTFTLREGITFHDGSDFTAEDVKYTYEFYADPENGSTLANNFQGMGTIETPDDYTVIINMNEPNAAFLVNAVADGFIVPSDYHAEVGEDAYRTAPIGTGPFKLAEWVPAEYTLLEANPDYFLGRPKVDFLRQEVVPEPSVRAIALETGEAHYATWPLLVEDSIRLRDSGEGYTVFGSPANSVKHFPLYNEHPILSDKQVRQAMMYALDRQRIIDDLWNGAAVIAETHLTPASSYHTTDGIQTYEYDPEMARQLLEEAGWVDEDGDGIREKDGEPFTFTCTTITGDQARRPIAELAQQFFADVGIDMQLAEAPVAAINEALKNGDMDCSLYNWTFGSAFDPDASTTLRSDGGSNFTNFSNERVDELLDLGLQETDPAQRAQYYAEIQQIVTEEVPMLYLQFDTWFDIYSPAVTGLPAPEDTINGNQLMGMAHRFGLVE
jgi:peptide/nickel transport system substrate-binding protein